MLNFGPCTITHNSVSLGKSFGGVSINLATVEALPLGSFNKEVYVVGGEGVIKLFRYDTSITITTSSPSTELLDFATVILDGGSLFKVTLYNCKITLPPEVSIGTNDQKAFNANLLFNADGSGNIIKIE